MKKETTMQVSIAALIKRINRRLAHDGKRLLKTRGARARQDVGDHYILTSNNILVAEHVDPESLAREIGVLSAAEVVTPEER